MRRRTFIGSSLAAALVPPSALADPQPSAAPTQADLDAWAAGFKARAIRDGLPPDVLEREFRGLTLQPRVVALDSQQPEFSRPISDYVQGLVSDSRVGAARARRGAAPWLAQIETRYGPPPEVLVAIWSVETSFGAQQGDFDVLSALASLAVAGRRRDWAEDQIDALIRIIATGEAARPQLKGSWAGAMGQTQLEPSAFLDDAVAFGGGGRPDVWGSAQDALASAANLLAKAGWRRDEAWQREAVLPPGFDYALAEGEARPVKIWADMGVKPALGGSFGDRAPEAVLLLPAGATGPAFLAYPNHFIIRKYNNALAYALGVGLLADEIAGRAGVTAPWPHELPLSIADRVGAQAALAKLGYDPGVADGQIGMKSRIALRAWQKTKGLPADGYLTPHLAGQLVAEAASR